MDALTLPLLSVLVPGFFFILHVRYLFTADAARVRFFPLSAFHPRQDKKKEEPNNFVWLLERDYVIRTSVSWTFFFSPRHTGRKSQYPQCLPGRL
jgi:hypothetical protein